MYTYITSNTPLEFEEDHKIPKFINEVEGLSQIAKQLYTYLLAEMQENKRDGKLRTNPFFSKDKKTLSRKSEYDKQALFSNNAYVRVGRETLMNFMGNSPSTIRKYLKELSSHNLIHDIRIGLNRFNRIYLKCPMDAIKKQKESIKERLLKIIAKRKTKHTIKKDIKKDDAKLTAHTSSSSSIEFASNTNEVADIVSCLIPDCLQEIQYKQLWEIANGTTEDEKLESIRVAVRYCIGKEVKKNVWSMLCDAIKKGYRETVPIIDDDKPTKSTPTKTKCPAKKKNYFTSIYSHDTDLDELEKLADDYMIASLRGEVDD